MKKQYEEKYKNIYWLKPAFNKHFTEKRWRSFKKRATTTTALLLFFFFLFVAFLVFAGYIDIVSLFQNYFIYPELFFLFISKFKAKFITDLK